MLNYQQRNKEELIGELAKLHQRIDELESVNATLILGQMLVKK